MYFDRNINEKENGKILRAINESSVSWLNFTLELLLQKFLSNNGNPLAFLTVVHSLAVLSWPQLAK